MAVALHRETGEEEYLGKALFFAEPNKAILLSASMNERMAQLVNGVSGGSGLLYSNKRITLWLSVHSKAIDCFLDFFVEWAVTFLGVGRLRGVIIN